MLDLLIEIIEDSHVGVAPFPLGNSCQIYTVILAFSILHLLQDTIGDCSLVRRFYSPKVRKSEIKGSSFRRFVSPKVRKSDNDIDSFLF